MRTKEEILSDLMRESSDINEQLKYNSSNREYVTFSKDNIDTMLLNNMLIQIYFGYASSRTQYYCLKMIGEKRSFHLIPELAYYVKFDFNIQCQICTMISECRYDFIINSILECENIDQQLRDELLARVTMKKLTL